MKITIFAFGSRGDVQPYVALGTGLMASGHSVCLNTHAIFESMVREHGLDFYPTPGDPREVLITHAVADLGNNPIKINRWLRMNFKPHLEELFRVTLDAAQGCELMLISPLSLAAWHVAQKMRLPGIGVFLQPATPTRELPGSMAIPLPDWVPFRGAYNYLTTKFSTQSLFNMLRPLTNECRAEVLDLPPLSASYYWRTDAPKAGVPMIYGFSPSVVPKPANWGPTIQVSGYWFLPDGQSYVPPTDLTGFLESGPAPVYVGFGSMVDHEREAMTRLVVEAITLSGQRAILLGGWSELGSAALPDHIFRIDSVPHDWLFPRMAAVVHHGGAGTTAAGLRAGLPNVIVPFFGDQTFWGWRVHQLGVGPKWIPRKRLTAERLAGAISQAVADPAMKRRAAELGSTIRAEDGISTAVALVERFAGVYIP